MRGHMNEARVLISDRQLSQGPSKVDCTTRQGTALLFTGIHREFFDVVAGNAHVNELILQRFPGIVERVDTVVTCH